MLGKKIKKVSESDTEILRNEDDSMMIIFLLLAIVFFVLSNDVLNPSEDE